MNKTLITWIVIIVLVIIGVVVIKNANDRDTSEVNTPTSGSVTTPSENTQTPTSGTTVTPDGTSATPGASGATGSNSGTVKSFTVTGSNFSFTPSTMTVNKGDRVRVTFVNSNGMHDWRLDEFNAKTNGIQGGQSETIEFVADKTGTFEYYCSVGTHRQMGMKGTLTVK